MHVGYCVIEKSSVTLNHPHDHECEGKPRISSESFTITYSFIRAQSSTNSSGRVVRDCYLANKQQDNSSSAYI